jgi:hypothetical protein
MRYCSFSVAALIAVSAQAMAQDTPQTQQMPKMKPGLNLMGEKQVDPRVEEYRKAADQEYNSTLKKIPEQKQKNNDPWASVRSGEPNKK